MKAQGSQTRSANSCRRLCGHASKTVVQRRVVRQRCLANRLADAQMINKIACELVRQITQVCR